MGEQLSEEMVGEAPGGEAVPRDSISEAAGLLSQACAGGILPAGLGEGGRGCTQALRAAGVGSGGFWWSPGQGRCSEGPGCFEESRRKVDSSGVWRTEPCREAVWKTPLIPAFVNLKGNRFLDQHFIVAQRWWDSSRVGGAVQFANQGRWAEIGSPEAKLDGLMCNLEGLTGTGHKRSAVSLALLGSVGDRKSPSPNPVTRGLCSWFHGQPEHSVTPDDFLYFRKSAPRPGCLQVARRKGR